MWFITSCPNSQESWGFTEVHVPASSKLTGIKCDGITPGLMDGKARRTVPAAFRHAADGQLDFDIVSCRRGTKDNKGRSIFCRTYQQTLLRQIVACPRCTTISKNYKSEKSLFQHVSFALQLVQHMQASCTSIPLPKFPKLAGNLSWWGGGKEGNRTRLLVLSRYVYYF